MPDMRMMRGADFSAVAWTRAKDLLCEHMQATGASQTDIAAALGITQSWVSQFLAGKRTITRADVLVRLARLLAVAIDDLLPPELLSHADERRRGCSESTDATLS